MTVGDNVVLNGVVSCHPYYADGQRIVTSSIQGYETDANGTVYALTKHSRYELGLRLTKADAEPVSAARHSIDKVMVPGKKTVC